MHSFALMCIFARHQDCHSRLCSVSLFVLRACVYAVFFLLKLRLYPTNWNALRNIRCVLLKRVFVSKQMKFRGLVISSNPHETGIWLKFSVRSKSLESTLERTRIYWAYSGHSHWRSKREIASLFAYPVEFWTPKQTRCALVPLWIISHNPSTFKKMVRSPHTWASRRQSDRNDSQISTQWVFGAYTLVQQLTSNRHAPHRNRSQHKINLIIFVVPYRFGIYFHSL